MIITVKSSSIPSNHLGWSSLTPSTRISIRRILTLANELDHTVRVAQRWYDFKSDCRDTGYNSMKMMDKSVIRLNLIPFLHLISRGYKWWSMKSLNLRINPWIEWTFVQPRDLTTLLWIWYNTIRLIKEEWYMSILTPRMDSIGSVPQIPITLINGVQMEHRYIGTTSRQSVECTKQSIDVLNDTIETDIVVMH